MRVSLIDKDPFSNCTELMMFEANNCDRCVKSSQPREDGSYTNADKSNMPNRCSIQRDYIARMCSGCLIAQRSFDVCNNYIMKGEVCPYLQTTRPKQKHKEPKNQLKFF